MPVHDWSRVEAGLFDHFHHSWIEEIQRTLNAKVLPPHYYAMAEPSPAGFEPMMFYNRRWKTIVAVRQVSGDRVVAMIEVVSPGNKNNRHAIESFVRKTAELLDQRIHLLLLDLLPPGPRDPHGIHARIWDFIEGVELPKPDRPLTLAAYETDLTVRAYVVPVAVGDRLPDMPLFLAPRACVEVPLEETYQTAFAAFPRRWRHVLDQGSP